MRQCGILELVLAALFVALVVIRGQLRLRMYVRIFKFSDKRANAMDK